MLTKILETLELVLGASTRFRFYQSTNETEALAEDKNVSITDEAYIERNITATSQNGAPRALQKLVRT